MLHNQEAWNKSLFLSIVISFGRDGWRSWRVAKEMQVSLSFMNIVRQSQFKNFIADLDHKWNVSNTCTASSNLFLIIS